MLMLSLMKMQMQTKRQVKAQIKVQIQMQSKGSETRMPTDDERKAKTVGFRRTRLHEERKRPPSCVSIVHLAYHVVKTAGSF